MRRMLLGHDLRRRRLGPWLYVPFGTVLRCLRARGQTWGSLLHTLGGGLGVLSSRACFWHVGQSCLRPFGPSLAPDIDAHNRWIMASQTGDKTERQDRKRRGKRGVLAGLCFARAAKDAPTVSEVEPARKQRLFHGEVQAKLGQILQSSFLGRSKSHRFGISLCEQERIAAFVLTFPTIDRPLWAGHVEMESSA